MIDSREQREENIEYVIYLIIFLTIWLVDWVKLGIDRFDWVMIRDEHEI